MGKWHISTCCEGYFDGDFDSKEDAIKEGIARGYDEFWVGQDRPPKPLSDGVFASEVTERALENLEDWQLDIASFEPTKDHLKTLEEELRLVVDRWFDQYPELKPKWFLVSNPERIEVDEFGKVA